MTPFPRRRSVRTCEDASEVRGEIVPWQTRPSRARGGRVVRAVATLALVVLAAAGVVNLLAPRPAVEQAQSAPELPDTLGVDVTAASEVAQSIARAYLTLDDPAKRTQRLQMNWSDPKDAGWNGQGSLALAGNAYTVATRVLDAHRVDVTVALFADPGQAPGVSSGWIGLLVPIRVDETRASAAGEPRIVGLPAPAPIEAEEAAETDSELTTQTRGDIEAFLAAWGAGDASAVVAPGASVSSPHAGTGTPTLTDWRVEVGEGTTRRGQATVTWQIGEAALSSTYQIDITQVASGTNTRWQVFDIH